MQLRAAKPDVRRAIVKLNEGVSGIGNTVVDLTNLPDPGDPAEAAAVLERLRNMQFEVDMFGYPDYIATAIKEGAVVEEMLDGEVKLSPSVQMRISPLGEVQVLYTHDQMLGGPSGQSYLGAIFPADPTYSRLITREAVKVGERLAREGVVGRFVIDFLVIRNGDGDWEPFAIEINLRKGGTTHPFLALQYLTDGLYDPETGNFTTELGGEKCYVASDHIESEAYRNLTTEDLFDLVSNYRLHYDHTCQTGLVLHMFSKIAETGRIGVTAIHNSPEQARALYDRFVATLDVVASAAE
ncbi:MAG: peptide ligase PGM1-related protein [Chloroflexota bacterium]